MKPVSDDRLAVGEVRWSLTSGSFASTVLKHTALHTHCRSILTVPSSLSQAHLDGSDPDSFGALL